MGTVWEKCYCQCENLINIKSILIEDNDKVSMNKKNKF